MFDVVSPESVGISSEKVLSFFQNLEHYNLNTHSIIMARGDRIFAEAYYAPFRMETKHRMYSISKSFTAIAVGLAEQDGLISLDDKFMKYFQEYRNEQVDALYEETTIRDLLTMRSCIAKKVFDYWGKPDRAKGYFDLISNQIPGTNFDYDSAGAFLLGCIVERVTGKPFMEYLKENILQDIGFSADAYCLLAPGGHSHSDSGVMCTSRDLLTFARFVMNHGQWGGKRYLNASFIRDAIAKQTDNNISGIASGYKNYGYGYLIWKAPRDGFAFVGMANQLAICDPQADFIFVITSEDKDAEEIAQTLIYHELYKTIVDNLSHRLPENPDAYAQLCAYTAGRKMIALCGGVDSSIATQVSGKEYVLQPNPMGLKSIKVTISGEEGVLEYVNAEGINQIAFGMGHNTFGQFPGKKRVGLIASVYEAGTYNCGASAIWCEDKKLHIVVRVIDTYMGTLSITLCFKNDQISVAMCRHAQRILDGLHGNAVGTAI